jgi:hypothetical protein
MYSGLFDRALNDSSIDYPRVDLDPAVWEKEEGFYFLRQEIKDRILYLLDQYPDADLLQRAREIRVVGSIGSNLYLDNTDIDVHVVPEDFSKWNEVRVKEVQDWYEDNESLDIHVGKHPIEVYVQLNPNQDLMSVAVYDVLEDTWIEGPKIVPLDYDPEKEFSHIVDDVRQSVGDADLLVGELRRDVIDYDTIVQAMAHLPAENKGRLCARLKNKLEEIEKDIEQLYLKRKGWVDARHKASRPQTPEQARRDIELAKKWEDINAMFKYINRYNYLRAIEDLEKLIRDDSRITPNEIDIIKGTLGNV